MNNNDFHRDIILDSIADGVFTVDKNWYITSFNRAAEDITGISREKAIGQKCCDIFRADICQNACALKSTIEDENTVINRMVNIINSEGITVPISISTAVLRSESGDVIGGVETFRDMSTEEMLRKEIKNSYTFSDIIGRSHEIRKIFDVLPDIARSDSTVLIEGSSGSGKELFAKAIHNLSRRKSGKFIVVNCSALPDTLLESELFGYVKGAFTDARTDKPGRFALAEGGTIFLDEIGDISPFVQVKLLRIIQEREYEPLGAAKTEKADVRIITATNKILSELIAKGTFREDLYYRLNVIKISIPSLSARRQDIPLLVDHILRKFKARTGNEIDNISEETLDLLMRHDYPGNVRELENILEHAFVLCRGHTIELTHLPKEILEHYADNFGSASGETGDLSPIEKAESGVIIDLLKKHSGNKSIVSNILGIHKTTLWRKIKKYNLDLQP